MNCKKCKLNKEFNCFSTVCNICQALGKKEAEKYYNKQHLHCPYCNPLKTKNGEYIDTCVINNYKECNKESKMEFDPKNVYTIYTPGVENIIGKECCVSDYAYCLKNSSAMKKTVISVSDAGIGVRSACGIAYYQFAYLIPKEPVDIAAKKWCDEYLHQDVSGKINLIGCPMNDAEELATYIFKAGAKWAEYYYYKE